MFRDVKLAELYRKVAEVDQVSLVEATTTVASAIYFATYFDPRQDECR